MSEPAAPAPRPVSAVAVIAIFFLLSLFWLAAAGSFRRSLSPAPQNQAPENLPANLAWRATPADRRQALLDLRKRQADQAAAYGWVDQKAGTVQLPIDRAVELIIKENGGKN